MKELYGTLVKAMVNELTTMKCKRRLVNRVDGCIKQLSTEDATALVKALFASGKLTTKEIDAIKLNLDWDILVCVEPWRRTGKSLEQGC
jgi:hypothetical protein